MPGSLFPVTKKPSPDCSGNPFLQKKIEAKSGKDAPEKFESCTETLRLCYAATLWLSN
jgi:hypothetical protein